MKSRTSPRNGASAFTLIELLVVMAIIAILASAGFAAGNYAIQRAKKTAGQAMAKEIEMAVDAFYKEYGVMPKSITADTTVDTEDTALLNELMALGTLTINTKSIKFLNPKEGKNDKNGVIYANAGATAVKGIYDPWGNKYNIIMDGDVDGKVQAVPQAGSPKTLMRNVAVWSDGADGQESGSKASDDVTTW